MTMPFDDEPFSKWSIEYWTASIVFFWKDWWNSRPRGAWTLVATLTTLVALFVLLSIVPRAMRESTRQAYEKRWLDAEKAEKWPEASVWLQRLVAMGDTRPVVRYHQAIIAEKMGRPAHAEAIMRDIADDSDFTPAHAWLAAQKLDENATPKEIAEAITRLDKAVKLNGEDEKLRLALADAYRRSGKLKEAANQILPVSRKHPQYNLSLARLYSELGDAAGAKEKAILAEKYFADKSQLQPESIELVEAVADSMMLQGKWQEALQLVGRRIVDESRARVMQSRIHTAASDQLIKTPETQLEAVQHLYQALEAAPNNRRALVKLARLAPQIIQISPRHVEPIRKWLTAAQEANPEDFELAALLGMLHMQAGGELEKAEKLLTKAAETQPVLLLDVAQIQGQLKKPEAREKTLRTVVEQLRAKGPAANETNSFAISEALSQLGQFQDAEQTLVDALAKIPSPLLRAGLSQIYFRQAEVKKEEAGERVRLLIEAVRVSEGHSPSEAALAEMALASAEAKVRVVAAANELVTTAKAIRGGHMVLGVIASRENRWNDAVFHFEQALSRASNDPALQNNLAWALAKRLGPGDAKRSLELAELAVRGAPQNPDIRETRGLAFLVNRQWPNAISDFEFTLSTFPERKHLHQLLAEAYRGQGNQELADKHAQLAN